MYLLDPSLQVAHHQTAGKQLIFQPDAVAPSMNAETFVKDSRIIFEQQVSWQAELRCGSLCCTAVACRRLGPLGRRRIFSSGKFWCPCFVISGGCLASLVTQIWKGSFRLHIAHLLCTL